MLAWQAGLARSTVCALLRREGLGRLDRLEPLPPVVRYERERPGELVHLDTKQLGRIRPGGGLPKPRRTAGYGAGRDKGVGWDRVHVAIDDHSRLAYVEELPDESPETTSGFLRRAWRFYARHEITIERILTDNGGCYRSRELAAACDELGIGHCFTRPYRPQTNGKGRAHGAHAAQGVGLRQALQRHRGPGSCCCPSSSTSTTAVGHTGACQGSRRSATRPSTTRWGNS